MSMKRGSATAVALIGLLSASCMTWRTKDVMTAADWPREGQKVLSVVKASGEYVRFSRSNPGLAHGGVIYGLTAAFVEEPLEVEGPFRSVKKRSDGAVYEVTDRTGRVYPVREVLRAEGDKLTILENRQVPAAVSVPFEEARLIRVKGTNMPLTLLAIAGGLAGAWFLWVAISLSSI